MAQLSLFDLPFELIELEIQPHLDLIDSLALAITCRMAKKKLTVERVMKLFFNYDYAKVQDISLVWIKKGIMLDLFLDICPHIIHVMDLRTAIICHLYMRQYNLLRQANTFKKIATEYHQDGYAGFMVPKNIFNDARSLVKLLDGGVHLESELMGKYFTLLNNIDNSNSSLYSYPSRDYLADLIVGAVSDKSWINMLTTLQSNSITAWSGRITTFVLSVIESLIRLGRISVMKYLLENNSKYKNIIYGAYKRHCRGDWLVDPHYPFRFDEHVENYLLGKPAIIDIFSIHKLRKMHNKQEIAVSFTSSMVNIPNPWELFSPDAWHGLMAKYSGYYWNKDARTKCYTAWADRYDSLVSTI